jgi:hypothetical protein
MKMLFLLFLILNIPLFSYSKSKPKSPAPASNTSTEETIKQAPGSINMNPTPDTSSLSSQSNQPSTQSTASTPSSNSGTELPQSELDKFTPDEQLGLEYTQNEIDSRNKAFTNDTNKLLNLLTSNAAQTTGKVRSLIDDAKANLTKMQSAAKEIKACNESAMGTADHCLESKYPGIQSTMSALGQLAPTVGMAGFRALCGSEKLMTENTCQSALTKVKAIKKTAQNIQDNAESAIGTLPATDVANNKALQVVTDVQRKLEDLMDAETTTANKYTPAYGMKIASGKATLLANAGANALQVAGTMMSGQKCDQQSAASTGNTQADICQQYPSICAGQSATPVADFCVTNPNDITCVCAKNVNDPACSGARSVDPGASSANGSSFNPADPNFSLGDASGLGTGFTPYDSSSLTNGGDGSNLSGGPDGSGLGSGLGGTPGSSSGSGNRSTGGAGNLGSVGSSSGSGSNGSKNGGSGLGNGLNGGSSTTPSAASNYGTGFNTDISKEGGSGTGSSGNGNDSSRKPSTEDLLKAFLPGGGKDPKKKGTGPLDGLTGAGGLSIFQKITRGYQRNTNTLIPN